MTKLRTAALGVAAALLLAACGTTQEAAAPPADTSAASPVSITDSRGKKIDLPRPATRVVGLEWNVAEHAVSLGVMPVGVADVAGYGKWVTAEPLDASVKDVGVRGEPSIDTIAALRPDLVLATDDLPAGAITQIEALAPLAVVKGADVTKGIGQMRENLTLVATATGKQAEGQKLLADFDASLAAGKAKLAAAGVGGKPFAFMDGYVEGSQVSIRPFAKGSLLGSVTEELGMTNAWTQPGDPAYGLGQTDVEGLTALGDVDFLYIANDADGGDPFSTVLGSNAVWKSLPFVKNGNVHRLPDGIWMFGGPTSMTRYVDAVVGALAT